MPVAVCVCLIRRCRGLFLITSLRAKLPAYFAGVLVETNRTLCHFSVFMCVSESGG